MIKINKKLEYALMVLKHMSEHTDKRVTAKEMCETYSIPFDTCSKVLQILTKNNIVNSTQGVNGGYSLSVDLKEVDYLGLSEIIEGKAHSNTCTSQGCSLVESCNITGPITSLNKQLISFFKSLTLDKLFNESINPINNKII